VVAGPPSLIETLRRFEAAHSRQSIDGMRACFHDEALIESVASFGQPLGADETAEALRAAFTDGVYAIGDWEYEQLAPDTVLSSTGARHRRRRRTGMTDETVCRLIIGRDGLIWRVRLFTSRAAALASLHQERSGAEIADRDLP
jgi:hypothetical protein